MTQPVTVEIVDMHAGIYRAGSTDGVSWYRVDVRTQTCTCAAGAYGFRHVRVGACRHLIASRVVARGLASMTPAGRARVLTCVRNIRVNVAAVDVARLSTPLAHRPARPQTAASGLLEAFGINGD
jgi:hypothetical protein